MDHQKEVRRYEETLRCADALATTARTLLRNRVITDLPADSLRAVLHNYDRQRERLS